MAYAAKTYDQLKNGAVKGLSDAQLDQHFTLYKGYVTKLNEIEEKLATIDNSNESLLMTPPPGPPTRRVLPRFPGAGESPLTRRTWRPCRRTPSPRR